MAKKTVGVVHNQTSAAQCDGPAAARITAMPPATGAAASFAPGFRQKVLLTVDTEEEFDWGGPFTRDRHGLTHVPQIAHFQQFCEKLGAHPVYLVDWPMLNDRCAAEIIGDAVTRGMAEVGVQLHPWVNPPFTEDVNVHNSFPGNLPQALEEAKFMTLRDRAEEVFGAAPRCYRAGRYGLGRHSPDLLKRAGIAVDTSVRTLFDYSPGFGPDFSHHPLVPYWLDAERSLLELPLSSVYCGALRRAGPRLQPMQRRVPMVFSGFSRLGLLERIALTPEGVSVAEGLRGLKTAIDLALPVLVLSFHSPSLVPGHTPYCRTEGDVERLYRWFTEIYSELDRRGIGSTTIAQIAAAAG